MPGPRLEPFQHIRQMIARQRRDCADNLVGGQWDGEIDARNLVAQIKAYDQLLAEMNRIAGGGIDSDDAGEDILG
jgi:hypothetical protein